MMNEITIKKVSSQQEMHDFIHVGQSLKVTYVAFSTSNLILDWNFPTSSRLWLIKTER